MKPLGQQRENVLSAYSFETFHRAIPVLVGPFEPLERMIKRISRRQFLPKPIDEYQSFRPSLVAVSSDHVVGQEEAVGMHGFVDFVEQGFELEEMVQRLNSEN